MKLFLAGSESRPFVFEIFKNGEGYDMRMFPAGENGMKQILGKEWEEARNINIPKVNILQSFYYVDEKTVANILPHCSDFLLDSGAFTFLQNVKNNIKWEDYIKRYADFINKNDIKKFFELDIDSVVGYKKVLEYRKMLEDLTGKKSIPVWHKSRGKQDFIDTCKNYPYVALGGIVIKEITKEQYKYFPWFIDTAHKYGAKIHGLGFTSLEGIKQYHFDSVDSTAWTTGNRFGYVYKFDGKTMTKTDTPKGMRLADSRKTAIINFTEWVKFSKYVEKNY